MAGRGEVKVIFIAHWPLLVMERRMKSIGWRERGAGVVKARVLGVFGNVRCGGGNISQPSKPHR